MAIDKFFIVNVLLLAGLVAGAAYLQKTYDTDRPQGASAATTVAPAVADSGGWHLSTPSAPASTAAPAAVTPTSPAPVAAPKHAAHRVYNGDRDDE